MKKTCKLLVIFLLICQFVTAKSDARYYYNKGVFYYDKKDYNIALQNFKSEEDLYGLTDDLALYIARCYVMKNQSDEAYKYFIDREDKITGEDIVLYAYTLNRLGNYKEAIKWYYKIKDSKNAASINLHIDACRWALTNDTIHNIEIMPSRLAEMGQSFGIQYFKNGVVFSFPEKYKKGKDYVGGEYQSLFYADLIGRNISEDQKQFSKNLRFPYHIGAITFSHNYTRIYYTRSVFSKDKKTNILKIYSAEYDAQKDDWINEQELPFNSDEFSTAHPAASFDNQYLYFTSDRPGGYGSKDLYRVKINSDFTYGIVENLGSQINTPESEMFPYVSKTNHLYFASNGHLGFGGLDIYYASIGENGKFQNVKNLQRPINSSLDDFAFIINPNNPDEGFISSDRNLESDVIYSIGTPRSSQQIFASTVEDSIEGTPLENCNVVLMDVKTGNNIASTTTDKFGNFKIQIPEQYRSIYSVYALKILNDPEYKPFDKQITQNDIIALNNKRIGLARKHDEVLNSFSLTLVDEYDGTKLGKKHIVLRDATSKKIIGEGYTGENGNTDINIDEQYQKGNQFFDITITDEKGIVEKSLVASMSEMKALQGAELKIKNQNVTLPEKFNCKLFSASTNLPIIKEKVSLIEIASGKKLSTASTDENGTFALEIPESYRNENTKIGVQTFANKKEYDNNVFELTVANFKNLQENGISISEKNAPIVMQATIRSNRDSALIANATAILKDSKNKELQKYTSNANGEFTVKLNAKQKGEKLSINISNVIGYNNRSVFFTAKDENALQNIFITPKDSFSIEVASTVISSFNSEPVEGATVTLINPVTGQSMGSTVTKADGSFLLYLSTEYKNGKEFEIDVTNGNNNEARKLIYVYNEIEDLKKESIILTPIFNDLVLDNINQITISHNKTDLLPEEYDLLDNLAETLISNPNIVIRLNAQTDSRGEKIDNLHISQNIANIAKDYLVKKGVKKENIIARGYADRYLRNQCESGKNCTEKEHQINNRIDVVVWKILK